MDKEERGRRASVEGFAYEHIAAGILMKKYQNVSLVDLPLSPYDLIIGVHPLDENSFELYFFPTVIVEQLNQKSISLSRVSFLKNNYFFLENCKNYRLVIDEIQKYGLIR